MKLRIGKTTAGLAPALGPQSTSGAIISRTNFSGLSNILSFMSFKRLGSKSALLIILIASQSANAALISFDRFVGHSNITDDDISCVAPNVSFFPQNTCGARNVFLASQAPGLGFFFPRFNTDLGTLNTVRISYNLNTGGTWIGRPEASFLSISTDFNFTTLVGLYSDHFGDQSNVDARLPTWNGQDELDNNSFLTGINPDIATDIIDGGSTSGSFNARQNQETQNWSLSLNGSRDFAASDAFLFTPGVTPSSLQSNVQVLLLYDLFASLNGRGADCGGIIAASCGVTNRVTFLSNAKITLTYDYDPVTVVPIPATFWLFGSALAGLGWIRRINRDRFIFLTKFATRPVRQPDEKY